MPPLLAFAAEGALALLPEVAGTVAETAAAATEDSLATQSLSQIVPNQKDIDANNKNAQNDAFLGTGSDQAPGI